MRDGYEIRKKKKKKREKRERERRGREEESGREARGNGGSVRSRLKMANGREKEGTRGSEEERGSVWKHVEIRGTLRPDQRHENLVRASLPADRPHSLPTRFPRTRTLSACLFRRGPLYPRARLYRQPRIIGPGSH